MGAMRGAVFFQIAFFVAMGLCFGAWAAEDTPVNPFTLPGSWYKANLHTHTTVSDGDVDLPVRVEQYKSHGYDILAVSDHEKTSDVAPFCTEDFLLISGMETHPKSPNPSMAYHLLCINVPLGLSFEKETPMEERLKVLREAGVFVVAAHPYWCGFTLDELLPLREHGVAAMEVYNSTCRFNGRADSSVHWDHLLSRGWRIPAIAVDDVHSDNSLRMGWTMIKAESLTLDAIMAALRAGAFYASTGPEFTDMRVEGDSVVVECTPVQKIQFYAPAPNGSQILASTEPLTKGVFTMKRKLAYVRATITDANGKEAWSPVLYFD
jgi:hypothetical protein